MIVKISKGQQITIPSEIRKELKLKAGSRIEVIKRKNEIVIRPLGEDLEKLFEEAKKIVPKHKLTAEQMDKLIEDEILRQ
ncbi:AbrB/MazE/SpoVT family DNA-binding domain-containing protein [Candidatus Woesearchaeota archaeon]|nr:AbrB/MazE/SpoVT family DNA-binding domain-containing protein [Candidatus Woesearchaeota archaeon]